jgi:hypothetical protein
MKAIKITFYQSSYCPISFLRQRIQQLQLLEHGRLLAHQLIVMIWLLITTDLALMLMQVGL